MRLVAVAFLVLCIASSPTLADASDRAPFGLSWGMSKKQIAATGVTLNDLSKAACGEMANAFNLPKTLTDTQEVVLCFGFDDKLWRVVARSSAIQYDRDGSRIKQRYQEISQLLSQRYGNKSEEVDTKPTDDFFKASNQYAYALSNKKTVCYSNWESDNLVIQLGIGSEFENTFYYTIYEYKPLRAGAKEQQRRNEKDAL